MSRVTEFLKGVGVPKELLDYGQTIVNKYKGEAAKMLPTASELAESVKRQPNFKQVYRALPPEGQKAVDRVLESICTAALVKVKKALGL